MRVLLFGASGMVGQGILRECLLDKDITEVLSVSRSPLQSDGVQAKLPQRSKLREIVRPDLFASQNFTPIAAELAGFDACLFPLGVSSFRMSEADYTRITRDLTLAIAHVVLEKSPQAVFVYVSGAQTDANSKTMWARVKGETENALLAMPFRAVYLFRPGAIIPKDGIRSKTAIYNTLYVLLWPVVWMLSRSRKLASTTRTVGIAMLRVVHDLPDQRVWENLDIRRIAGD